MPPTASLTFRRVTRASVAFRVPFVGLLTVIACGDPQIRDIPQAKPFEAEISADLGARFSTSVTTRCLMLTVVPLKCIATLADGTELPIAIEHARTEWQWHVDGVVIEAAPIVAYVEEGLAGLHVAQQVDCGSRIQVIKRGDRVVCKLAGGGAAFVDIAPDGSTSLELALDAATATVRTELTSADRDRELTKQSKDLEPLAGQSDGEEAVAADAGVP